MSLVKYIEINVRTLFFLPKQNQNIDFRGCFNENMQNSYFSPKATPTHLDQQETFLLMLFISGMHSDYTNTTIKVGFYFVYDAT